MKRLWCTSSQIPKEVSILLAIKNDYRWENKRRPIISSESQCFLENSKQSASKTHHCILFPAPALETAGSHARTTRASIDLLRSILRNRIRAVVFYIIARVSRSRNSFNIHHFETVGISDRFTKKRKEEKFPRLSCLIIVRFYGQKRIELHKHIKVYKLYT